MPLPQINGLMHKINEQLKLQLINGSLQQRWLNKIKLALVQIVEDFLLDVLEKDLDIIECSNLPFI